MLYTGSELLTADKTLPMKKRNTIRDFDIFFRVKYKKLERKEKEWREIS
jgi:hypothetical protein